MPIPSQLSTTLRQRLGDDAGDDLVTWLDEMRAEQAQFRQDMLASEGRILARMDQQFAKVDQRFAQVDQRFVQGDTRFASIDERFAKLEGTLLVAIADSKADLMKWMLVFWVGAVGAIAALAGVLK